METDNLILQVIIYTADGVILLGAVLAAIQTLTKASPFENMRTWLFKPVRDDLTAMHDELKEVKDTQLKLMICSEELPLVERVAAGEIYVNKRKLNGEVKARYKVLREKYETELKKGGKL